VGGPSLVGIRHDALARREQVPRLAPLGRPGDDRLAQLRAPLALADVAAEDRLEDDEVLALRRERRPRLAVAWRGEGEVGAELEIALRLRAAPVAAVVAPRERRLE